MVISDKKSLINKELTSVMEDYLETIVELREKKRVVRVKDIAEGMNVKMSTVTSMLKTLNSRGLVNYAKYEYVDLTKKGAAVGKEMQRRHGLLLKFLTEILKIDLKTADEDACRMEHALSPVTLDSFVDFMEFVQTCPRAGENWLQYFKEYQLDRHRPEKCQARSEIFSSEFKKRVDSG